MAEKNYKTVAVVPEMPRTIDNKQLHIYTPVGSTGNFGVFKPDGDQFVIVNGVLRADVTKLIQLADPPAIVTENGGPVGVDIAFTEPDNTLNRKFQFTFKNIKGETGATGATGAKGDTGDNALVYSGSYTETYAGDVTDEPIHLEIANFSRTPVKGDTFVLVYYTTETEQTTISLFSIYNVYDTYVEAQPVFGTQYVITGPKGEQGIQGEPGTPGKDGDDGVSITSVTQTGVQGGTQVTITLSNGQSTSFIVYNGINTNFQVVNALPTENISTSTIYLVPATTPGAENVYDEYIYVNGNWEHIGSTSVDLSDYVTKTYFNQNVGDATKNYIAAQLDKVHNLYIEMYESGSVPVVGQALTLTNANFARMPVVNQYFGLLEVVNTKDKYYTVCQILSVDTTTCSAKVVAVTEVTNGTEIDSIKASIATLNTDLDGKADTSALDNKLDKVKTTTTNPQVYAKNADGTQGMVNVGGTADDDLPNAGQINRAFDSLFATVEEIVNGCERTENKVTAVAGEGSDVQYPSTSALVKYVKANAPSAYHVELDNPSGTLTKDQVDKLVADTDSYVLYTDANSNTYKLCRNIMTPNAITYSVVVNEQEYRVMITLSTYEWQYTKVELQNVMDRVSSIGTGSTVMYPNTKAVYDADQSTLNEAKSYTDTAIANAITTALNTPV